MSSFLGKVFYAILGLIFAGYLTFQLQGLFFGSRLVVIEPENGAHLKSGRVIVKGMASGVNTIDLNGRRIFTDEAGNFEEELYLPDGFNIVSVSAEGRFGREFSEQRMLYITGL